MNCGNAFICRRTPICQTRMDRFCSGGISHVLCSHVRHDVAVQELLNGPHTRVRVDMATAPAQGGGIVSPKGKGRGGFGRQTGMLQFFKGAHCAHKE